MIRMEVGGEETHAQLVKGCCLNFGFFFFFFFYEVLKLATIHKKVRVSEVIFVEIQ
jgi:hypothetical protein